MKKILAALLALTMSVSLFACGTNNNNTTPDPDDSQTNIETPGNTDDTTPTETDYGTLSVSDTYAWLGEYEYPATEFALNYSKAAGKTEKLTYEYDEEVIELDEKNHTVKALKNGTTTVKIKSEHFDTSFKVTCETVELDTADKRYSLTNHANGSLKGWETKVNGFKSDWSTYGSSDSTTLFIGDSFFDQSYFWATFYDDYSGKDARCYGIGSTTTYTWETVFNEKKLGKISPLNVVLHIGTNNVYDIGETSDNITSSLERLFMIMHTQMPDAKLYWLNITQRFGAAKTEAREATAVDINERFTKWAEGRDWLTVVDTRSKLIIDKIKTDGVHPNADGYEVIMNELAKSGIEIYNS